MKSPTPVCLIIIPVCLFILDKRAGGYSYYFENILTITLFLIYEIQIFFLLCTILNKSFNLIIILLFYDNWFNFQRVVLLLGFGNLAGWYSYFLGTIIRHTRVTSPAYLFPLYSTSSKSATLRVISLSDRLIIMVHFFECMYFPLFTLCIPGISHQHSHQLLSRFVSFVSLASQ